MRLTLPTCFATRRMTARPLEAADLEWLVTLHQNPLVMQNIGGVRSRTITEAWLQSNLDHWAQHGFGEVVLDHASSGARIGRGGLRMIDECVGEELVEVGYVIDEPHWRQGFATEAAGAFIDLAFASGTVDQLGAITLDTNVASAAVLERVGFRYERMVDHRNGPHKFFRLRADDVAPSRGLVPS